MSDSGISESIIEQAALIWLERLGWTITHGPDIAPGEPAAERADYGQVAIAGLGSSVNRPRASSPVSRLSTVHSNALCSRDHSILGIGGGNDGD